MQLGWQQAFRDHLAPEVVQWDEQTVHDHSKDFHTFSPVLVRQLDDKIAQCVVSPRDEAELDAVLSLAAQTGVPLTVRGGGTGNYGQCVPLTGGVILNLAKYQKILEVGPGWMRVQSGVKMGKMEMAARAEGFELRMLPSTFQSATIGGFLGGGFGGIGSITWGTIWDKLVRSLTIKTLEVKPRTFTVEGDDVLPYLHTYGTIGILSEVELNLAPRTEWRQWAVTFDTFDAAFRFAEGLALDPAVTKRLVSVIDAAITPAFLPLDLPAGRPVVFTETDDHHTAAVTRRVDEAGGTVNLSLDPSAYHGGIGVSDFSWNHTTLWARKSDSRYTYLQIQYENDRVLDQVAQFRRFHPEMLHHIEFARQGAKVMIAGLPLVPFTDEAALNRLMDDCNAHGLPVANPHTADLEDGGRSFPPDKLWKLKGGNDPFELLNQNKLKRPATLAPVSYRPHRLVATPVNGRLRLQVTRIRAEAKGVLSVEFRSPDHAELPAFEPGAHVGLYLANGSMRQYSLVNDPAETHRYTIAVALGPTSRGGSRFVHSTLRRGDVVEADAPQCLFPLVNGAKRHVFLAGGIGVTPLVSMARRCQAEGRDWKMVYTAHSRQQAAFADELVALGGDRVTVHVPGEHGGERLDVATVVAGLAPGDHLYCCGPTGLMLATKRAAAEKADQVSYEWFGAPESTGGPTKPNRPFEVKLKKSGVTLNVAADQTLLEAMEEKGLDAPFFCRSGICRTCESSVCAGAPDHRDFVLTEKERVDGKKMMICVSRADGPGLELDL
jgi:ferredoxin-NADP reductase/FAD/FMN-containing dehydrogenase